MNFSADEQFAVERDAADPLRNFANASYSD
jgi:hypothetical protein